MKNTELKSQILKFWVCFFLDHRKFFQFDFFLLQRIDENLKIPKIYNDKFLLPQI